MNTPSTMSFDEQAENATLFDPQGGEEFSDQSSINVRPASFDDLDPFERLSDQSFDQDMSGDDASLSCESEMLEMEQLQQTFSEASHYFDQMPDQDKGGDVDSLSYESDKLETDKSQQYLSEVSLFLEKEDCANGFTSGLEALCESHGTVSLSNALQVIHSQQIDDPQSLVKRNARRFSLN
jgi:hypothetical protein